jgi:hypothetical protein
MKTVKLLYGLTLATVMPVTAALHAQPVTLSCQLRKDPSMKSQVTFDESTQTAFFREEGEDADAPSPANFRDTEITWQKYHEFPAGVINMKTTFTLDRLTGGLAILTTKVGHDAVHAEGDELGSGILDCSVVKKQF